MILSYTSIMKIYTNLRLTAENLMLFKGKNFLDHHHFFIYFIFLFNKEMEEKVQI